MTDDTENVVGEHIRPGSCADTHRQYLRGIHGESLDVTSLNRPDPRWRYVDVHGHLHQWYDGDHPATSYSPFRKYHVPTLTLIVDVEATDEYPAVTHYECTACLHARRGPGDGRR